MKRFVTAATMVMMLAVNLAAAEKSPQSIGIGLVVGAPTGASVKVCIAGPHNVECNMGVTPWDNFYLSADYLYKIYTIPDLKELSFFVGGGLGFESYDRSRRGREDLEERRLELRIPLAMEFMIPKVPVGLTLELAPAIRVVPDASFGIRGGVGARYYF